MVQQDNAFVLHLRFREREHPLWDAPPPPKAEVIDRRKNGAQAILIFHSGFKNDQGAGQDYDAQVGERRL